MDSALLYLMLSLVRCWSGGLDTCSQIDLTDMAGIRIVIFRSDAMYELCFYGPWRNHSLRVKRIAERV